MAYHRLSQPNPLPLNTLHPSRRIRASVKTNSPHLDTFISNVYLPHAQLRKRSWQVDARIARQYIYPVFGDREVASIHRCEVEAWLLKLSVSGLASATCNRILAVFKSICLLAVEYGLLPFGQSPCADVSSFKIHTQRERYLSSHEARRLMRALKGSSKPESLALQLLLLTGARKSEILKARWEFVRLDQRLLTVPLSKSGKPRHILLSDEAMAVILSIPRVPDCPWLFPGHNQDKPLSDIYLFWNRLRRKLSLTDVRIHDLRHTFASFLVNAGHSLYEVQRLLGHSDPRTTMRYAHLGQASLVAATQTVSSFLILRSGKKGIRRASLFPQRGTYCTTTRASPSHGKGKDKKRKKTEKKLTER